STAPPESIIENAVIKVKGVKGVHNILVSKIRNTDAVEVSLHIQVNRSATLIEVHFIASEVENSIRNHMSGVDNITVHLEFLMSEISGIEPVSDSNMDELIKEIILDISDVKKIGKIATYRGPGNVLKIDVACAFNSEMTIERIHKQVSDIEMQIRL